MVKFNNFKVFSLLLPLNVLVSALMDETCNPNAGDGQFGSCDQQREKCLTGPDPNNPGHTLSQCVCISIGFTQNHQTRQCEDIDECNLGHASCLSTQKCINTIGSYRCECIKGYFELNLRGHKICKDVDECARDRNTICGNRRGGKCINKRGSYECQCKTTTWYTGEDGKCYDVNECEADVDVCDATSSTCLNEPGSYVCNCKNEGFYKVNPSNKHENCVDVNECEKNAEICEVVSSVCNNTYGAYKCDCKDGFYKEENAKETDGCQDIDECMADTPVCDSTSTCKNNVGSYECACKPGWTKPDGAKATDTCVDINECEAEPSVCNEGSSTCKNSLGSYSCECKPGYSKEASAKATDSCQDINECLAETSVCSSMSTCKNNIGSYECVCKPGYTKGPGAKATQQWITVLNNYGFFLSPDNCVDINECEVNPSVCNQDSSTCKNNLGSYSCECKSGYNKPVSAEGFPPKATDNCQDINECLGNTPACDSSSTCKNNNGSYECVCKPGYSKGNSDKATDTCADIDECNADFSACNELSSTCKNEPGSFSCECKLGYNKGATAKVTDNCSDINECDVTNTCSSGFNCINLPGTFTCTKTKINECELETPVCDSSSVCNDLDDGYSCNCKIGFKKENGGKLTDNCVDVNECETEGACNSGFKCVNSNGSFTCVEIPKTTEAPVVLTTKEETVTKAIVTTEVVSEENTTKKSEVTEEVVNKGSELAFICFFKDTCKTWEIILIIAGVAILLIAIILLIVCVVCKKKVPEHEAQSDFKFTSGYNTNKRSDWE